MPQKSEILHSRTHMFSILEKPLSASCTGTLIFSLLQIYPCPKPLALPSKPSPRIQAPHQNPDHLSLNCSLLPLIYARFNHTTQLINHWLTIP